MGAPRAFRPSRLLCSDTRHRGGRPLGPSGERRVLERPRPPPARALFPQGHTVVGSGGSRVGSTLSCLQGGLGLVILSSSAVAGLSASHLPKWPRHQHLHSMAPLGPPMAPCHLRPAKAFSLTWGPQELGPAPLLRRVCGLKAGPCPSGLRMPFPVFSVTSATWQAPVLPAPLPLAQELPTSPPCSALVSVHPQHASAGAFASGDSDLSPRAPGSGRPEHSSAHTVC